VAENSASGIALYPVKGVTRFSAAQDKQQKQTDLLSIEEPLEIIVCRNNKKTFTLAITMRTPGNDDELAAGFLFAEGLIKHKNDLLDLAPDPEAVNPGNSMLVTLTQEPDFDPDRLQRYFFSSSSCGVCGKTSMQALELLHQPNLSASVHISTDTLCQLPAILRQQQQQFSSTGGAHSAALFSPDGKLLCLREDVGRHNAMDKLIGSLLLEDQLQLARQAVLLVSGRASFELVQKALMADIPILASIGAPTSLAYQLANRHNMTLAGFLKSDSFNIYNSAARIN
jgi:FdhD protein